MDVVILCGGKGTRLSEETVLRPKPMVEIGGKPILWHIMKYYSYYGFNRFILTLGYKADWIKNYFYNYRSLNSDFTIKYSQNSEVTFHSTTCEDNWEITLVDTGLETLKGARIKRVEKYIESENFHLTYGDGICDVDLHKLTNFHESHNKLATVTAVRPPSRFGEMDIIGDVVKDFEEKPQLDKGFINGGFFILNKGIMKYLNENIDCDFEFGPMQQIAKENELRAFKHKGFWQCMDNIREKNYLKSLVESGEGPWLKWK